MSNWFVGRGGASRKSPRLSPAPAKQALLSSGSLEKPIGRGIGEMKLEGNVQGLYNPLAWENMPSSLREKFPHWKEASHSFSQSTAKDDERAIYSLKSSKQPPCTIPYVVMDRDTIQGIAVKFETTPSEIARINKKPTLTFSIFPGDFLWYITAMFSFASRSHSGVTIIGYSKVLYVPDQDELAKLAPPPSTAEPPVTSSTSSGDSETTPTINAEEGGERGEEEARGVVIDGVRGKGETEGETSLDNADTHISILSKYISEDQGCVHGSLIVNKSTLMFTPNNQDPLVKEHGVAKFEIIIPIGDITYAAITHSVSPPRRRSSAAVMKHSETATLTSVTEEQHDDQPLAERDGVGDGQDIISETERQGGEGVDGEPLVNGEMSDDELKESENDNSRERRSKKERNEDAPLITRTVNDVETNDEGAAPSVTEPSPPSEDAAQVELAAQPKDEQSMDLQSSNGPVPENKETGNDVEMLQEDVTNMVDDALAVTGEAEPPDAQLQSQHSTHPSESSDSVTSLDALLADSPYFLHLCVSPKSHHSYTYTPINSSVGIDIPRSKSMEGRDALTMEHVKKSRSLSPPVVHHVRNKFCFAVIDKRLDDLVEFISQHHPTSRLITAPPTATQCWIDEAYEFINVGAFPSNEDLSFRDDHFQSSSWEIYSLNDIPRSRIDRMDVEANLPLPDMSDSSDLLLEDHIRKVISHLPYKAVGRDWYLIYSTFKHGISLRTLYRNMMMFENEDSPIFLVVRDEQKKLFGAVVTCRIRISEKFYGTGESFLYLFDENGNLKIFPWTGINNYVVKGNSDSFSIGSGDGHPGLWLDESFYHGASYKCSTFNNDCLASGEEFICSGVEAWGFL